MKSRLEKLEMVRGFAALYVFAGHLILIRFAIKHGLLGFLFRFGQDAVILFFLLSGFVVYYSCEKYADTTFSAYFARRARRIFPIFLLALGLTFVCSTWLGNTPIADIHFSELVGNLCMLQDFAEAKPGVWISPFCGNLALWSLSYEWWFYMLFFPIYRFICPSLRLHAVAGISMIGLVTFSYMPNQASLFLMYFILWWTGAELARTFLDRRVVSISSQVRSLVYLVLFCGMLAIPLYRSFVQGETLSLGVHPILELRHFGACLAFVAGGLVWARFRWVAFTAIFGRFTKFASISYALYVFHMPLAVTGVYLSFIPSVVIRTIGYVAVTILVAGWAEGPYQRWINRVTSKRRNAT